MTRTAFLTASVALACLTTPAFAAEPEPSLHSDLFYPVPEPTIKTGVVTMSMAVLELMGKK